MAQAKEFSTLLPPPVFSLHASTGDTFDFEPLLTEALAPLRRRATIKRIALRCAVPAGLPRLCADRSTILRRVRNLLSQVLEGTERGGAILCTARLDTEGDLVMELQIAGYGLEHRAAEGTAGPLGRLLAALRSVEFDLCPELDGRLTVRLRFPADGLRPGASSSPGLLATAS